MKKQLVNYFRAKLLKFENFFLNTARGLIMPTYFYTAKKYSANSADEGRIEDRIFFKMQTNY